MIKIKMAKEKAEKVYQGLGTSEEERLSWVRSERTGKQQRGWRIVGRALQMARTFRLYLKSQEEVLKGVM